MKKMTLNNIYEWPVVTKILLGGLVSLFIFYIGYQYNLSKQIQNLARNKQQEEDLKQQIDLIIRKDKMTRSNIAQLPELKSELEKWNEQFISYKALPGLLNDILKLGGDNHLFFSLFTPGEPVKVPLTPEPSLTTATTNTTATTSANPETQDQQNKEEAITYIKLPIKTIVVGDYHQIANFMSQVANMQWIIVIKNFTLSNDNQTVLLGDKLAKQAEAQHLLSAELMLDVYYLPEKT